MAKEITIDDIARELGISKSTVSRALSGKGRIGKETVEKVKAYATEHKYPIKELYDANAAKTYNIAMITPKSDDEQTAYDLPFFRDCMYGICDTAFSYNYDVIVSFMNESPTHISRIIANKKVDGVIMNRSVANSDAVNFLKAHNVPFVVIGPTDSTEIVNVDNPNREGAKELTEVFLMKGATKLALLGGDPSHFVTVRRKQGFFDAYISAKIPENKASMFMNCDNLIRVRSAVDTILEMRMDGIICMDDYICELAMTALRERGVPVPNTIKLATMYDSPKMEASTPSVTGVKYNTTLLGKNACLKLLELLGEKVEDVIMPLNYQLILRESTK